MIYVDNAATTKMSQAALAEMQTCFEDVWGNPSSLYAVGQKAAEALWLARERIAACIGASPKEIYFTSGGSESDNQAIISAATNGERKGKKHIISTMIEHHAVLHTLRKLAKQGFDVELLQPLSNGLITAEQVAAAIREDTCLVAIMYANNEIGTIMPIAEIGAVCRAHKVPLHTDAVQAAGHLPIDVKTQNIDLLALSAHKFNGPKGHWRHSMPLRVSHWLALSRVAPRNAANEPARKTLRRRWGMAAALEEACQNMPAETDRLRKLQKRLIEGLAQIPHSALNGDCQNRLPGNVNFCFEGIEGESLLLLLDDRGICASSGSACTSGSPGSQPCAVGDRQTA